MAPVANGYIGAVFYLVFASISSIFLFSGLGIVLDFKKNQSNHGNVIGVCFPL